MVRQCHRSRYTDVYRFVCILFEDELISGIVSTGGQKTEKMYCKRENYFT